MQEKSKIKTIGIVGGGQLGRMICFAAHKMGYKTIIFCDKENSPASFVTNKTIIANYDNKKALAEFAQSSDIITFEFENIPYEAVEFLDKITPVLPKPQILKITQDRILEKTFLQNIGINVTDFAIIKNLDDLQKNVEKFGKSIIKTTTLGYDGKGQYTINNQSEIGSIWQNINGLSLILEKFCPFDLEISTIVARSKSGQIKTFAPVYNQHKNSILDKTIYPAPISRNLQNKAQDIACKIAKEIDLIGVLAVEFFVLEDDLLVNELAPRPHNSGHITMDLCLTSQFEQLIRSIVDINLGDVSFFAKGYMQNLIGEDILNIEQYYQNPKAKIHLYDKSKIAIGRKMGHVNLIEKI